MGIIFTSFFLEWRKERRWLPHTFLIERVREVYGHDNLSPLRIMTTTSLFMQRNRCTVEEVGVGMVSTSAFRNTERRGYGLDHLSC